GLARAAHRGVLAEALELLRAGAAAGIERGPYRPRRDRVDADAFADELFRQRARERGDRALAGAVIEQLLAALVHDDARAVDDRRPFPEVRPCGLGQVEHRVDVGLERALELFRGDVADVLVGMLLAGVVDQNVEPAPLADRLVDQPLRDL